MKVTAKYARALGASSPPPRGQAGTVWATVGKPGRAVSTTTSIKVQKANLREMFLAEDKA